MLTGKSNDGLVRAVPIGKAFVYGIIVLNAAGNAGRHHHCPCLAVNFLLGNYLLMEMLNHHGGFLFDGEGGTYDKTPKFLLRPFFVEHGVILDGLHQAIKAVDGCIVGEYIENESFLNGLLHGIDMEGTMLDLAAFGVRDAEGFEGLVLRGGSKGKVTGVFEELSPLHHGVDFILVIHVIIRSQPGQGKVHLRRISAALPGMCLVNDDSKTVLLMLCA